MFRNKATNSEPVPPILPLSRQGQGTMFGGLADVAPMLFSLASTNNTTTTPTIVPDDLTLTISLRRRAGVGNTGENAGDSEVSCGVSAVFGRVSISGVCFRHLQSGVSHTPTSQSLIAGYGGYAPAATFFEWMSLPPSLSQLCLRQGSTAQEHWWDAVRRSHPTLRVYRGAGIEFLEYFVMRRHSNNFIRWDYRTLVMRDDIPLDACIGTGGNLDPNYFPRLARSKRLEQTAHQCTRIRKRYFPQRSTSLT